MFDAWKGSAEEQPTLVGFWLSRMINVSHVYPVCAACLVCHCLFMQKLYSYLSDCIQFTPAFKICLNASLAV